MKFKTNEGKADRIIRFVLGAGLLIVGFSLLTGIFSFIVIFLGGALIFTSITGFCGLYQLIGINTCPIKTEEKAKEEGLVEKNDSNKKG